jgi:hypothetical protein
MDKQSRLKLHALHRPFGGRLVSWICKCKIKKCIADLKNALFALKSFFSFREIEVFCSDKIKKFRDFSDLAGCASISPSQASAQSWFERLRRPDNQQAG